MALVHVINPLL